jgi:hypothetical protein
MHLDDGREETPPRASSHHHHHLSLSLSLILFLCAKVFRVIRAVQKSERGVLERFPLVWNGEKSRGFKFTLFVATF